MFKKILSSLLAVAMLASMSTSVMAEDNAVEITNNSDRNTIENYWNSVDNDDWDNWVNLYSSEVRSEYQQLVSNSENHLNNIGILTVESSEIVNIEQVSNDFVPVVYNEVYPSLMSNLDYTSYVVDVQLQVDEDNGYFSNGLNTFLFTISNDSNNNSLVNTVSSYDNISSFEELGRGFQDYTSKPSTINVRYQNGELDTINFTDFIFNVTCNEIGNEGYLTDAIKANAVAIKMCGWWAKAGAYYPVGGFDISHGTVAIDSVNNATSANQDTIRSVVDTISNNEVLSSGGKLFYMSYHAGLTESDYGQSTGQMRQLGSKFLANQGYDWKQIINHFYNNSFYNNDGVGTIKIS